MKLKNSSSASCDALISQFK